MYLLIHILCLQEFYSTNTNKHEIVSDDGELTGMKKLSEERDDTSWFLLTNVRKREETVVS